MTGHTVESVEILLWSTSAGQSAFVAPWTFDLWHDKDGKVWIDADRQPLNVDDYPRRIDRYRALDGPGRTRILKAAFARREEYLGAHAFGQYMVRHQESGIDEVEFLGIVAAFVHAWRRKQDASNPQ